MDVGQQVRFDHPNHPGYWSLMTVTQMSDDKVMLETDTMAIRMPLAMADDCVTEA